MSDAAESRLRTTPNTPRTFVLAHEARDISTPVGRRKTARPEFFASSGQFSLAAVKSVQSLSEQRQRDHGPDDEEGRPCNLDDAPEGVSEDSRREARGAWGLVNCRGQEQNRLSRSGEKRVRIALGQQFSRARAHLGADEHEFRMQLPGLDVSVRGRLTLVDRPCPGPSGRLSGNGAKPGFELELVFDGDDSQITRSYRLRASLT